jgi:poly-gamma-glutamate synthesis protein (capsule biosynthesis protein)
VCETLDSLHQAGISTAGAGNTLAEACAPTILDVPHKGRVIVLALGHRSSGIPQIWGAQTKKPGVCLLPDLSTRAAEAVAQRACALRWASIAPFLRIRSGVEVASRTGLG